MMELGPGTLIPSVIVENKMGNNIDNDMGTDVLQFLKDNGGRSSYQHHGPRFPFSCYISYIGYLRKSQNDVRNYSGPIPLRI